VVAIVAILIALLMPALTAARRQALDVQCASNERQLCVALLTYATANRGHFPANDVGFTNQVWIRDDCIGPFARGERVLEQDMGMWTRACLGGVFVCPRDEDACLTYAMNMLASSRSDSYLRKYPAPPFGGPQVPQAARVILMVENVSVMPSPYGYMAYPLAGMLNGPGDMMSPGRWFGGGQGIPNSWGPVPPMRYGVTGTWLSYMNHRRPSDGGTGAEPKGRLNIGYCDGHVEMKSDADLFDPATGKSRFDSLWSPYDYGL
jgi:prepilin-type processing-associated H-X9-DG protein